MFSNPIIITIVSVALSAALTFLVRELAHRYGFVAKPKTDRWHKRPTAMMGGTAIFSATVLSYSLFGSYTLEAWIILGASALLFLVGLVDDILHIKPYQKLIGQFVGAGIVIYAGLTLQLEGLPPIVNIALTVFWIIGITNAINLLDNMDGLAAGISAIAAFSLAVGFGASGQINELTLISAFVGALVGFLIFNFNPASIFMGDCGSMFIGFLLSTSVLMTQAGGRSRGVVSILAVPALILFVPIFDTTFVTVLRKIWGRKASQGGRDHTSHRLVALGLSERSAVLMLYGFAILAGVLSLLVRELQTTRSLALIASFSILLAIIGVYLSKVKVYDDENAAALENRAVFGFLLTFSHKRRIFEVFLDVFLITLSYYAAYGLLFRNFENTDNWQLFLKSLPVLIILKLSAFLVVGVYRGIWRYTSVRDFLTFTKGVALGSVLSALAVLWIWRFIGYSRAVFVLDGLILLFALTTSRMAFRFFRQLLPMPLNADGRKILIYGAGDGGEMVLRELKNNSEWNYKPVGFVDDDPLKKNKVIHGLKVFGGNGSLEKICRESGVQEVLISCRNMLPERLEEVRAICRETNVSLKRAELRIEPVEFE